MRFVTYLLSTCLIWASVGTSYADTVKAPRGWDDEMDGHVRIVRNDEAYIEIRPWESLHGATVKEWVKSYQYSFLAGAEYLSSNGVTKERHEGAYSITRSVKLGSEKGYSVLYGCPGQPGFVRLLLMEAPQKSFGKLFKGGFFIERVCKKEPKGRTEEVVVDLHTSEPVIRQEPDPIATPEPAPAPAPVSRPGVTSGRTLSAAEANALIPAQHRPSLVTSRLKQSFKGFPATLTYEATISMTFPNGYTTSCADWDPLTLAPTPESVGAKVDKCTVSRQVEAGSSVGAFEPGQTVDVSFGRVSATGFDGHISSSTQMSGGDLMMTRDGRIAVGRFSFNSIQAGTNNITSTRTAKTLTGDYYLNGYTITIVSDDGEVFHGFTGFTSNENSLKIDHLYLNGEHYWDRKKTGS